MCQQWFSVAGLFLDVVGFLLIAFEWRHMFFRERERRIEEQEHDYERKRAYNKGGVYRDPDAMDFTMTWEFSKLAKKEWRYRKVLFYGGVVLVILGFFGQTAGSWPGGLLSFKSC
jgi:hypothetical protein